MNKVEIAIIIFLFAIISFGVYETSTQPNHSDPRVDQLEIRVVELEDEVWRLDSIMRMYVW